MKGGLPSLTPSRICASKSWPAATVRSVLSVLLLSTMDFSASPKPPAVDAPQIRKGCRRRRWQLRTLKRHRITSSPFLKDFFTLSPSSPLWPYPALAGLVGPDWLAEEAAWAEPHRRGPVQKKIVQVITISAGNGQGFHR